MMQHEPDLTRPLTEIERIFFPELEPKPPAPVQVPGFRNPNDPRIPKSLLRKAQARAAQAPKGGRR